MTRAFLHAGARVLRIGDITAHDAGSELYAIALLSRRKPAKAPSPADCRAVAERIAAAMSIETGRQAQTGWTIIAGGQKRAPLRQHMEAALERGLRERERYAFFAAVGHELRTPLASIRGYLQTLLQEDPDPETTRRFLEIAHHEALRMARLLDGMFEFSLLDLSAIPDGAAVCDLRRQLPLACEALQPLARERSISIEVSSSDVQATIAPDACSQLLVNLVQNAIKYGRDGGRIVVRARKRAAKAIITVDDDGPGIRPFTARKGTGIGLTIVKTIVERAGGSVRSAVSPIGGARFQVALPAKRR